MVQLRLPRNPDLPFRASDDISQDFDIAARFLQSAMTDTRRLGQNIGHAPYPHQAGVQYWTGFLWNETMCSVSSSAEHNELTERVFLKTDFGHLYKWEYTVSYLNEIIEPYFRIVQDTKLNVPYALERKQNK